VSQFSRLCYLSSVQFLNADVARLMVARLHYLRLLPGALLYSGCDAVVNLPLLRERYADVIYLGIDSSAAVLDHDRQRYAPRGVARLLNKLPGRRGDAPQFVCADLADTRLAPESLDLVWSNLAMHWHPAPHSVLAEWRRVLKVGGLAMFSCLGPATLREL